MEWALLKITESSCVSSRTGFDYTIISFPILSYIIVPAEIPVSFLKMWEFGSCWVVLVPPEMAAAAEWEWDANVKVPVCGLLIPSHSPSSFQCSLAPSASLLSAFEEERKRNQGCP